VQCVNTASVVRLNLINIAHFNSITAECERGVGRASPIIVVEKSRAVNCARLASKIVYGYGGPSYGYGGYGYGGPGVGFSIGIGRGY
jgi:hypothetical protein